MDNTGTGRRKFLKTVATAGAMAKARPALAQKSESQTLRFGQRVAYPRKFTGRQLAMLAFPLGGIGAGAISLGGRGQLRDWEIFNRPDKGKSPQYAFASIWAQTGSAK
jgi:non-lysosomal glucosylceramidase